MDKPIRHSRRLHTGRMRTDTGAFGQVRSIVLRRYPHRDPNFARRGCFGSATALATAMTSSTRVCMPIGITGRRSRHARAHVFYCVFCLVTGGLLLSVWWFLGVCDTPVVGLFSKGFWGVWFGRVCVGGWVGVSYSLAAGRRGSPRWGGSGWPSGGGLRTQERVCTTL